MTRLYASATAFDATPVPTISDRISGRGTRLVTGPAVGGGTGTSRSASISTRWATPTVTRVPHTGHSPPSASVSFGSSRTPQVRCPSIWYLPSSGKNSTVPPYPSPLSSARRMAA
ncbi:hypothetical protein [Azospirillum fermentarium]|uniref:hypothetical protein n=1 Tax=Azospirillum fermentarium TaxID=1233114 RepID=UPI003872E1DD